MLMQICYGGKKEILESILAVKMARVFCLAKAVHFGPTLTQGYAATIGPRFPCRGIRCSSWREVFFRACKQNW
jgi:hypothetical protein